VAFSNPGNDFLIQKIFLPSVAHEAPSAVIPNTPQRAKIYYTNAHSNLPHTSTFCSSRQVMVIIDWKKAEKKLERMMASTSELDVYLIINIVAPLSNRYHNNHERSVRLYNAIMGIRFNSLAKDEPQKMKLQKS